MSFAKINGIDFNNVNDVESVDFLSTDVKLLCPFNGADETANPYAHYKCNDNAGNTNVVDDGTGDNDGTASTNTSNLSSTGKINEAFEFNGSTEYIDLDALAADVSSDEVGTISLWFNHVSGNGFIFSLGDEDADAQVKIQIANGYIYCGASASTPAGFNWRSSSNSYGSAGWVHVVFVQDGSEAKIYINGSEDTGGTFIYDNDRTFWVADADTVDTGRIGCTNYGGDGAGNAGFFTGKVDDVRYYQRAISADEVSFLWNSGNGTERSGVDDYSLNPKIINTVANTKLDTTTKKFGSASLELDGSSYLYVTDSDDFNLSNDDFTLETWFYCTSAVAQGFFGHYTDNSNLWLLSWSTSNYFRLKVVIGGTAYDHDSDSFTINTATWYHLAVVRSGTTVYFFINGADYGSDTMSETLANYTNSLEVGSCRATNGLHYPFYGRFDMTRLILGHARWTSSFTPPTREYSSENKLSKICGVSI